MKSLIVIVVLMILQTNSFSQSIQGAWKRNLDTAIQYLTIVDNYFSIATFNVSEKRFIRSRGGTAVFLNGKMDGRIEFNTADKDEVGKDYSYGVKASVNSLDLDAENILLEWQKIDDASGGLSGNWRIIGREQEGKMIPMKPGARKTIKILSATHFQWIAINTDTGEFFGTGGGEYSFKDGKYTEKIQFFSRDPQRVGASLSFNAELKDGDWHHSGLSSKGDRIYEVWSRK